MDLDADPEAVRRAADRLTGLAGDLLAAAHRLPEPGVGRRPPPAGPARRCADLANGLRADAAELLECARRLREDRAALLVGEDAATSALRSPDLTAQAGWAVVSPARWAGVGDAPGVGLDALTTVHRAR